MSSDSNACSSLCHPEEPCAIANDGECIGWWPEEAWTASAQIGAAMDEVRLAWLRYLSHPDGSQERRAAAEDWRAAYRRQRAAEAGLSAALAGAKGQPVSSLASNEILPVRRVSRDGGDYVVQCPHCGSIVGVEGDDLSEVRGEQYQHRGCGGWLEVTAGAVFVKVLGGNQ